MVVGLSAREQPLTRRQANVLRIVLAALSTVFAYVGVVGLMDLLREPEHSLQDAWLGLAAFGALAAGGAAYSLGVALWSGRALALRAGGWTLMVLALVLPSQLELWLPLACMLVVGLQRVDRAQADGRTESRTPRPHRGFERRAL